LGFGAAEFASFEKPEEKQRRTDERKRDAYESPGDRAKWEEIQQKARSKSGNGCARRLAARIVLRAVQQFIDLRWGVERWILLHGNLRIAAHSAVARMVVRECVRQHSVTPGLYARQFDR